MFSAASRSPKAAKTTKHIISALLFLTILFSMISVIPMTAYATYETKYGIVNTESTSLSVRSDAGISNTYYGSVAKGSKVVIVGEKADANGTLWYQIEFKSGAGNYGYVSSDYIKLETPAAPPEGSTEPPPEGNTENPPEGGTETPSDPVDFEAWMDEQGFPESYKDSLRALHEKYPNWVFYADHIDYTFEEVIAGQSVLGVSLVENSFPSSWKSTQEGAYNWEESKWIPLDGTRWVQASREIIAFYLDPRNFLDSETVFQFLEQRFDEKVQTVAGVQSLLDGTFMSGNVPDEEGITYAQLIYDVAKENNLNPYVLAAMLITEQGTTGSYLCNGKPYGTYNKDGETKYYNFFNYGAFGSDPVAAGLDYAKSAGWDTVRKSITYGASSYASGYISVGQSTLYYKRFDFIGTPFTHQYSQSIYSPKVEGERAAEGYTEEMRNSALVFTIPVYDEMPETPSTKPTGDGSPNIKLSSLKIDGYTLMPLFQPDILEYSLIVPADTASVNITATPMDSTATVTGAGAIALPDVNNVLTITVKSGNGSTRNYTLTITKEAPGIEGVEFSGTYALSGTYVIAAPGVTAETMAANLLKTGSAIITLSDGSSKEGSDALKTGDKILVYDENNASKGVYVVCVKGDVNGNGEIDINDFVAVRNHLLGSKTYTGISASAADIDLNGSIDILDFTKIRNHLLGATIIS